LWGKTNPTVQERGYCKNGGDSYIRLKIVKGGEKKESVPRESKNRVLKHFLRKMANLLPTQKKRVWRGKGTTSTNKKKKVTCASEPRRSEDTLSHRKKRRGVDQ